MHTEPQPVQSVSFLKAVPYQLPTSHFHDCYGGAKFDWNEPSLPPPPQVQSALIQAIEDGHALNRYPDMYQARLKAKIAEYISYHGRAGRIVLFNGSDAALRAICTAYLKSPNGRVLRSKTTYSQIDTFASVIGIVEQFFSLDTIDDYDSMNLSDIDIVYIVNPNNPTGKLLKRSELTGLFEKYPAILFVIDEAYMEFVYGQNESCAYYKVLDEYKNVVVVRTFSKAFRLAGLRIGYTVSGESIAANLRAVSNGKDLNTLACIAAIVSLDNKDRMHSYTAAVRNVLSGLSFDLASLGLEIIRGEGNFLLVRLDQAKEVALELSKRGIYVRSGLRGLEDYIRVSIDTRGGAKLFFHTLAEILGGLDDKDH